jgi:cell wall-associated NlpC family hydrolase
MGVGVDCAQFLIGVFAGAGTVAAFDTGEYPEDWMMNSEVELFLPWIDKYMVQSDARLPGDIVLWQFGHTFSHAAVIVDYPSVIHAYRRERAVVWGDASQREFTRRKSLGYTLRSAP